MSEIDLLFGDTKRVTEWISDMTGVREFTPAEAHSVIRGYEYQACECDDWTQTEAYAFCLRLKLAILERLAPVGDWWSVTDEKLGRVPA